MTIDEKGLAKLHEREGLRLKPYLDTQGVPTIAMGNTFYENGKKVTMQDKPLSLARAKKLGSAVAMAFSKYVDSVVLSEVNQNQHNALTSLCYNIGQHAFNKSTVLRLVNMNPIGPNITKAFMMWTKNKELIGRRKSEVAQYFEPLT